MKHKTLVTRFVNIGYELNSNIHGIDEYLEIQDIIRWLFINHNIVVNILRMKNKPTIKYIGVYYTNSDKDFGNNFSTDKYHNTPEDAYFDAVRVLYRGLKFRIK